MLTFEEARWAFVPPLVLTGPGMGLRGHRGREHTCPAGRRMTEQTSKLKLVS